VQRNRDRVCIGHYAVAGLKDPSKDKALKNTVVALEITDTAVARVGSLGTSSPYLDGAIERLMPHPVRYRQAKMTALALLKFLLDRLLHAFFPLSILSFIHFLSVFCLSCFLVLACSGLEHTGQAYRDSPVRVAAHPALARLRRTRNGRHSGTVVLKQMFCIGALVGSVPMAY